MTISYVKKTSDRCDTKSSGKNNNTWQNSVLMRCSLSSVERSALKGVRTGRVKGRANDPTSRVKGRANDPTSRVKGRANDPTSGVKVSLKEHANDSDVVKLLQKIMATQSFVPGSKVVVFSMDRRPNRVLTPSKSTSKRHSQMLGAVEHLDHRKLHTYRQ